MDLCSTHLLNYTWGLSLSRTGIHSLAKDMATHTFSTRPSNTQAQLVQLLQAPSKDSEMDAFLANLTLTSVKDKLLYLNGAQDTERLEEIENLLRTLIQKYFLEKETFDLSLNTDSIQFSSCCEGIKLVLQNFELLGIEPQLLLKAWRIVLAQAGGLEDHSSSQSKVFINFLKYFVPQFIRKASIHSKTSVFEKILKVMLADIYDLLKELGDKPITNETQAHFVYFLIEAIKNIVKIVSHMGQNAQKNIEGHSKLVDLLREYLIDGVFFLLCKLGRENTGQLQIHLGCLEVFKEYLLLEQKEKKEYRAELGTMLGVLVLSKMKGAEKRLEKEAPLNIKEQLQIKGLFDFIEFLLSEEELLIEFYFYNDFTEMRTPLINQILDISLSVKYMASSLYFQLRYRTYIYRKVEVKKFEDPYFSLYLKNYLYGSVVGFLGSSKTPSLTQSQKLEIKEVIEHPLELIGLAQILGEKPKKFYSKFQEQMPGVQENEINTKICAFLQENTGLNGSSITALIGADNAIHKRLRLAFMNALDFRGLDILKALRRLFWIFHMTGETQVIDRIICDFSEAYIIQNPDSSLKDSTSVYTYSICIIMLNTNLHNPQIDQRMTLADFFKNVGLVIPKGGPGVVEMTQIYNEIEGDQIKALITVDMINETSFSSELWNFVHTSKNKRNNLIQVVMPPNLQHIVDQKRELINSHIAQTLKNKINQIVQDNLLFFVMNSCGESKVISELFTTISERIGISEEGPEKLSKLFRLFLDSLNLKDNLDIVCYEEKVAWTAFSLLSFFESSIPYLTQEIPCFLELLTPLNKFMVGAVQDSFVQKSHSDFNRMCRAFMDLEKKNSLKKTSFIDAFTGFLNMDERSGEMELGLVRSNSLLNRVQSLFTKNEESKISPKKKAYLTNDKQNTDIQEIDEEDARIRHPESKNLMSNILLKIARLENIEDVERIIKIIMQKIIEFKIEDKNAHICALMIDMVYEITIQSEELRKNKFKELTIFFSTVFSAKFENSMGLEIKPGQEINELAQSKAISKYERHLKRYSTECEIRLALKSITELSLLESVDKILASSFNLYKGCKVQQYMAFFNQLTESIEQASQEVLNLPRFWDSIKLVFEQLLSLFEGRNFKDIVEVEALKYYLNSVKTVMSKLDQVAKSHIKEVIQILLSFITHLVSSKTIRASCCHTQVLLIYSKILNTLEPQFLDEDWEKIQKSQILMILLDHFFRFLLMNSQLNPTLALRSINLLLHNYQIYRVTSSEHLERLINYLENYSSICARLSSSNRASICEFYCTLISTQLELETEELAPFFQRFGGFMGSNYDYALENSDDNLKSSIHEDTKKIFVLLSKKEKQDQVDIVSEADDSSKDEKLWIKCIHSLEARHPHYSKLMSKIYSENKLKQPNEQLTVKKNTESVAEVEKSDPIQQATSDQLQE